MTIYRVTEREFQIIMDGGWWNYVSPESTPMFVVTEDHSDQPFTPLHPRGICRLGDSGEARVEQHACRRRDDDGEP